MSLQPVTYIKAGETPTNWFDLSVIDNATGKDVRFVVEADTKAGWVRRKAIGRDGRFLRAAGDVVTERINGDFSIVNPGVPGCPVEMQPAPGPRTFPTTRMIFERNGAAVLVGPCGEVRVGAQVATILMVLCGKAERHVSEWMDIAESLWPHPDDMPDGWCVLLRVRVHELRKALKSIGSEITIVTHWGRGFSAMRPTPEAYADNDNQNSEVTPAAGAV